MQSRALRLIVHVLGLIRSVLIINDQLSALAAYSEAKSFEWSLFELDI